MESTEVINLSAKDKVCQLSICQENNEEHNCKAEEVFGTPRHGCGELTHSPVKVDEFEELNPDKKYYDSSYIVELYLPIRQMLKVGESILIFQELQ